MPTSRSVLVSFSVKSHSGCAVGEQRTARRAPDARPRWRRGVRLLQRRPRTASAPRPDVAEPERRQDVQRRGLGAAVGDRDLDQDVFGRRLRVLDEHVEVAVAVEHARVEQLVLEVRRGRACRLVSHEVVVGIGRLRVLVEILHVRVRRRRVEIEVVLLDVLAVVALAVGQAEQPLLEDRDPCRSTAPRAKQSSCWSSEMPARPSSPQRYARERAWSWLKWFQASPESL